MAAKDWRMVINGERVVSENEKTIDVRNPATGEVFASAPAGTAGDVDNAVAVAREAFEEWRETTPEQRGEYLFAVAEALEAHHDELVELETRENGKPLFQAENDVTNAERITRFYAGAADKIRGDTVLDSQEEVLKKVYEPFGVVGIIIPWNWPPIHTAEFGMVAVATGNTVVLKPAPDTPLSSIRIAEIAADILPDGVFNVVTGGVEPGVALSEHADVDKLAFTGNDRTGVKVLEAAAKNITPAMMELGGKNPALVFPDADMEKTLSGLIYNAYYNSGQACTNPERMLVHEEIYDEFLEAYATRVEEIVVGDGMDEYTEVGPLVNEHQVENFHNAINGAESDGATIAAQADVPDDEALAGGYYAPPTLLDDVTPDMSIACREVFGPVIGAMPFSDEAEAVELANDIEYGLAASVWTTDVNRAHRVANAIEAGILAINHPTRSRQGLPFGGYKRSGIGRKKGLEETMLDYMQAKSIQMDLTDKTFSFSYGNR